MRDFLVIGAGSAGCVLAAELARRGAGKITVLEAGPTERHPLVSMPFGLVWLMGGQRDWAFRSAPQTSAGGRQIAIPRGRMVGGSGSINSMVWFRGRKDDFDAWNVPGWSWSDVEPAFEAVERELKPTQMPNPHPLTHGLTTIFGANAPNVPSPEYESAGVFSHNMIAGRRISAADAFLRQRPEVELLIRAEVDRILWEGGRSVGVLLIDGSEVRANKGVILTAGSIGSPAILMRSGVGPKDQLEGFGIQTRHDAPEVGENLHDHPSTALHFQGKDSGYGLEIGQWPAWALSPFLYALRHSGRLTSPTVEGGAFFNARGTGAAPDVQSHFIPFFLDWAGRKYRLTSGYFADICLCRPKSRGSLRLSNPHPKSAPVIDLGLLSDASDLETMTAGVVRLRTLLDNADFGHRRAAEAYPGPSVTGAALEEHIRTHAATAYHPVGTLRLGGPVTPRLRVVGTENLWVADASVMPQVTSANTNAPAMMIGWKGAEFISEDAA